MPEKSESKAGRPAKYKTPEELEAKIKEIEKKYANKETYLNVYLLAVELDFESPSSLWDYCNRDPKFSTIIKKAKNRIWGEKIALAEAGHLNPTVIIFQGKVNHGMIEEKHVIIKDESSLIERIKNANGRLDES
jgi:hypothetical protein